MYNAKFPELVKQMALKGETQKDVAKLIGQKYKSQVSRRLDGKVEWTIGDIEILCEHYNMDFHKLFKRKEN